MRHRLARLVCFIHGHRIGNYACCERCGKFLPKMPIPWRLRCPRCRRWSLRIRRVPQNTSYQNERDNWFTGCPQCQERNDAFWEAQWADLYNDLERSL